MQIEFLVNGGISILLAPDNSMEEELLKQFLKQDNVLTEFRTPVQILNKSFRNGMLIQKKSNKVEISGENNSDNSDNENKK